MVTIYKSNDIFVDMEKEHYIYVVHRHRIPTLLIAVRVALFDVFTFSW